MTTQPDSPDPETITDTLATCARICDRYPAGVAAIIALVAEHSKQDPAAAESGAYEGKTRDFADIYSAVMSDPRLEDIQARMLAEYVPTPLTRLQQPPTGEVATFGAPMVIGLVLLGGLVIVIAADELNVL